MSFCHCVYKIYYRFFAFSVLKNYAFYVKNLQYFLF